MRIGSDVEQFLSVLTPSWLRTAGCGDAPRSAVCRKCSHVHFQVTGFVGRISDPAAVRRKLRLFLIRCGLDQWASGVVRDGVDVNVPTGRSARAMVEHVLAV